MFIHIIFIKVVQDDHLYDNFIVTENNIKPSVEVCPSGKKTSLDVVELLVDGILVHYFIRELRHCLYYRKRFLKEHSNDAVVRLNLQPAAKQIVDYKWNYRIEHLVRERCELEHTLSWLSTLGGAFSALGDYFANCAEMAGKISINQLKLAMMLDDPNVVARCRLYLSLSLIQQGRFKLAQRIIHYEYLKARNSVVVDIRLINMCRGIYCKLKYDWEMYKRKTSNKLGFK
ncbi:hypothetical protein FQR65_LT05034 [Abscondita terminalis]|nr:hypothetical protein FQR65_LT05034 [Abscondita terminalis]